MAKLSWNAAFVAGCMALGTVVATATPAAADGRHGRLCLLTSNAYQYDDPLGNYERTVYAGHHFRVHDEQFDILGRRWYFGHSGQSWWDDGYVLAMHVRC